jgi:TonB family protein
MKCLELLLIVAMMLCTVCSAGAAQNPQLSANDPVILSDTHGYNLEKYLDAMTAKVRTAWYSNMPDAAVRGEKARVVVVFTVLRDGTVQDLRIVSSAGTESLDQAAVAVVRSASPFAQLPADFSDNRIVVQFAFLYNLR